MGGHRTPHGFYQGSGEGAGTACSVRAQDSSGWGGPFSRGSSPDSDRAPRSPPPPRLSHPVPRTSPDHRHFLGRNIYCGSPCGSGGCSHWDKQRRGEPEAEKNKGRHQRGILGRNPPAWAGQPWGGEGCYAAESHMYADLNSCLLFWVLEDAAHGGAPWAVCLPSRSSRPITLCSNPTPPPQPPSRGTEPVLHSVSFAP